MTPGTTIALAVLCWTLGSFVLGLLIGRMLGPQSSDLTDDGAAHCHAELDVSGLPAGMVDHFHSGSISPKTEQDHA